MSSFGRKLRRAAANFTTMAPEGIQADLLSCAATVTRRTENLFKVADENVLAAVDLRDNVGALFVYLWLGFDPNRFEEWRSVILEFEGKPNSRPYMAIWVPRVDATLQMLSLCGFMTPPDWSTFFDVPPPAGSILTLLKFGGRGQLMHVANFEDVPGMTGPAIEIGGGKNAGAPAS